MLSVLEGPEKHFAVLDKKVKIYKIAENSKWQQMSQRIQGKKTRKMSTGVGS